jgi:hypothetical protein
MTRRILSTVAEIVGLVLIAGALATVSVPLAAGFIGVALIAASWALDMGGKRQ